MKDRIDAVLLALVTLWCLAILSAPVTSASPVYEFFSRICHQRPERSWFVMGHQLPVCIRCAAIYFGFFLALALRRRPDISLLKLGIVLTLAELLFELLVADSALVRAATGFLLGAAAAPFVRVGLEQMFGVREDAL